MKSFPGKVFFPGFSGIRWFFSREGLSKDSFHFHAFGGSFPGKVDLFPGNDFRLAAEGLFPGEEVFSRGVYIVVVVVALLVVVFLLVCGCLLLWLAASKIVGMFNEALFCADLLPKRFFSREDF